jgi:AraC-like DNA-binding protein
MERDVPSLPAIHALHLVELVERRQVAATRLLDGLGLAREELAEPHRRVPLAVVEELVERARSLTGEPALGVLLGMRMRISWHGFLGFAAMSASTVRDALELAIRYAPTRTDIVGLRLEVDGREATLTLEERAPLGAARETLVIALLVGIWQIGCALTGRELRGRAEVAFAEPSYFRALARDGFAVRWDRPAHRLIFDAAVLDLPLTMADAAALRLAREACERELDAIEASGRLVAQVRAALARADAAARLEIGAVAKELAVSPRTLKRRLAEHGTSFSALVEEQRRDRAFALLRAGLTVEEIAARLGYSDAANFTRAFRRWTGKSPRAWRTG